MRSVPSLFLVLAALLALLSSVRAGEPQYHQGVMLDAAQFDSCHYDCAPFDRPTLFFCLQFEKQILIGSRKADWKWEYDSSEMLRFRGKEVSFRYDNRSIWIIRTDGKDMRLANDYSQNVFSNPACIAEVHQHWLRQLARITRPSTVPQDAVLIPQGSRSALRRTAAHFWVACRFEPHALWDICETWDEKGSPLTRLECVDSATHRAVSQKDLAVDPLATERYDEIHLKGRSVLRDWAKARINGQPTPDSTPPKPLIDQRPERN